MGRTLKEWRVNKGLTQFELAKKIGVPASTYNVWERNPDSIKVGNVVKICNALEVNPQDIIFFDNKSHFKYDLKEVN